MKRREFVGRVGLGSAAVVAAAGTVAAAAREDAHDHRTISGPLANATVSFGGWPATFDRVTQPPPPPPPPNLHQLVPHESLLKAGGTVNFIIAGLHQVAVYAPGTKPEDIDKSLLIINPPGLPPFIDDPNNRVFRGISPIGVPADRVEVVHFPTPGHYLVICTVLPHFEADMYGWVQVLP